MRALLAVPTLVAFLAACADPAEPLEPVTSCPAEWLADSSTPPPQVDLVLAYTATADLADRLSTELAAVAAAIEAAPAAVSLHVAVLDGEALVASPRRDGCPAPDGDYLVDAALPWFVCGELPCRARNFDGALADALPCIGTVGTDVTADPLLDRLDRALRSPAAAAFRRPDAWLAVVIIAGADEASDGEVADHVARFAALAPRHLVGVVAPAVAPRLHAFARALDGFRADVAAPTWVEIARWFETRDTLEGYPACAPADADCVVTAADANLPPCQMLSDERPTPDTPLPCYRLVADGANFDCPDERRVVVEHATWTDAHATVHCTPACE